MKTETQVTISLGDLKAQECLYSEPDGFILKIFLAASRVTSKNFRLTGNITSLGQTLKVSNIAAKELQIWLCTNQHNKIIANATVALPALLGQPSTIPVQLKMTNTLFAQLTVTLSVTKREIEKIVYVEPDQQLLKKVEDPKEKQRKEQEQLRRQKELQEQLAAAKQVKKAAITITKYNKKDIPFI